MAKPPPFPPPLNMKLTCLDLWGAGSIQVWMRNSDKEVYLQGKVDHFRNGIEAVTFSCGFGNMWLDPDNKPRFSHHCMLPHIIKTRAYIVIGIHHDRKYMVVQYAHKHGNLVDMNDNGLIAQIIKNHPEQLEQEFLFQPVINRRRMGNKPVKRTNVGVRKSFFPKGASLRAMKAGLISHEEAERLARQRNDEYALRRMGLKK